MEADDVSRLDAFAQANAAYRLEHLRSLTLQSAAAAGAGDRDPDRGAHCPYGALAPHSLDGVFTVEPRLESSRCNGCGACEAICPVRPQRAIRVAPRAGILPPS